MEKEKILTLVVCFLLLLKEEIKNVWHCHLFPLFEDPRPSCLLPSQSHPLSLPFSSCPQCFPASGSLPMSQLLASGGQSIRTASVLPVNIQGSFPLGLTGLISLLSKGLSRVFSSTTVWKYKFFGAESSLWSKSLIHTWLLEKRSFDYT